MCRHAAATALYLALPCCMSVSDPHSAAPCVALQVKPREEYFLFFSGALFALTFISFINNAVS